MEIKPIISLIGMTGCGKTSVGRIVAKKLGANFIDLDEEIVKRYGAITDIFDSLGESGFRSYEYSTLCSVLDSAKGITILSTGGGVPTYRLSRELLKERTTVIWLRRSPDSIPKDSPILTRPPINGSLENYSSLMYKRYPIYRSTATYSFFNNFPHPTAAKIVRHIEKSIKTEKENSNA